MAYFSQSKKDQEKNAPEQAGAETVTSQGSTGQAGGGGDRKTSAKGTGFVGIGAYRRLNKPDASNMSREIADDATSKAPDVGGFLRKGSESVKGPGYTGDDIESVRRGEGAKNFSDWYNQTYGGPGAASEVEGYEDVQSGVKDLERQAGLTGSSSGRQQLMRGIRDGGYTGGEAKFDAALMGSSDGLSELDRIVNKSEEIKSQWQAGRDALNQNIQDTQSRFSDQRQQLADAGSGFLGDLSGRIGSAQSHAQAYNQRQDADTQYIAEALAGQHGENARNLQLDKLGVRSRDYGTAGGWFDQNPDQIDQLLQRSDFRADAADFLSQDDLGRMSEAQEIASLLGQDFQGVSGTRDQVPDAGYSFDPAMLEDLQSFIANANRSVPAPVLDGGPVVDTGDVIDLELPPIEEEQAAPQSGNGYEGLTEDDIKALEAAVGFGIRK